MEQTLPTESSQASNLQALLSQIGALPTPVRVYDEMTSLLANPRTSTRDVAGAVAADQAITARLLKLVNSPFYGFPEKITTVSRAVTIIGLQALQNLVLASAVIGLFEAKHRNKHAFNLDQLWTHSLATGLAARSIAKRLDHADGEEYLVAGLMHDMGKAVLLSYFPVQVDAILDIVQQQGCLFIEGERQVLGIDHAAIGAAIAEQWRLPGPLRDAIRMHHTPSKATDGIRASAVHLADILARSLLLGSGGDRGMPALNSVAYRMLNLKEEDLRSIMKDVITDVAAEKISLQ